LFDDSVGFKKRISSKCGQHHGRYAYMPHGLSVDLQ
jgi:hypothetical protein